MASTIIIGIDCATNPKKVGIARAEFAAGQCAVTSLELGGDDENLPATITRWLPTSGPALLAFDAPLGWPSPLGAALANHSAGEPLAESRNNLFRRATDRFVKEQIGKQSLDVGADRIARTAHAALGLLGEIRERSGHPIPLAWSDQVLEGPAAIEVYPAATLVAHRLPSTRYKGRSDEDQRQLMLRGLAGRIEIPPTTALLAAANADALDALVCVLAALDFLRGDALPPGKRDQARREGWIWVRKTLGG